MEITDYHPHHKKHADLSGHNRESSIRSNIEKMFEDIFSKKRVVDSNGIELDLSQKNEIAKILAAYMPIH